MIILSDNDIILKLAQCGLLSDLPSILEIKDSDFRINSSAKYQLLSPKKPDKAIAKCGSRAIYDNLEKFINSTAIIEEIKDRDILTSLGGIAHIDPGEQQLIASCVENNGSILMTGDKNCLNAIQSNQDLLTVVNKSLMDSVITLESALLLSIEKLGFDYVIEKINNGKVSDGMLKLALREKECTGFCECLFSFTSQFYGYLAFKDRLPSNNSFVGT